jgi:hypothetical protein
MEDLKDLANSLGFCWPEDETGQWRCLKSMAETASYWRAKIAERDSAFWNGLEKEKAYAHLLRRNIALATKVGNLRRALRDYMTEQAAFVREQAAELERARRERINPEVRS